MQTADLARYGLPSSLLQALSCRHGSRLLPFQEHVLTQGGILADASAIVRAPTGSGKTLLGECAALRAVSRGGVGVFVVPTRALAEELWEGLEDAYAPLGLRVRLVTGEHSLDARAVRDGEMDLLVSVPEKLLCLLTGARLQWLTRASLVVDEFQHLWDPGRGAALEEMLTRLLAQGAPLSLVGLTAVPGPWPRVAEWLGAELHETHERPVSLRMGVLADGRFRYRDRATGAEGSEPMAEACDADDDALYWTDRALAVARSLIARGESVLAFAREKRDCYSMAADLSEALDDEPALAALAELDGACDTAAKSLLEATLRKGVAFHNADLPHEMRGLVERAVRRGEIRGLFATSTLALGVNLGVDNVILDARPRGYGSVGVAADADLRPSAAENMAGRAGRLCGADRGPGFGRALFIAANAFEAKALWDRYVLPTEEPSVVPPMALDPVPCLRRSLGSGPICPEDAGSVVAHSLSSWSGALPPAMVDGAVEALVDEGRVKRQGSLLLPSRSLRVAARSGLSVETVDHLQAVVAAGGLQGEPAIARLFRLPLAGLGELPHFMEPSEGDRATYDTMFRTALADCEFDVDRLEADAERYGYPERARAQKAALMADAWIGDDETLHIEVRYRLLSGAVERLCRALGRLCRAGSAVAPRAGASRSLRELALRLETGTHDPAAAISRLRVAGLSRDHLRRLIRAGYDSPERCVEVGLRGLATVVPEPLARRIIRASRALRATAGWQEALARTRRAAQPGYGATRPLTALVSVSREPGLAAVGGQAVSLATGEWRLLARLAQSPGECVPYSELAAVIGLNGAPASAGVRRWRDRLLRRLRRRADHPSLPRLIETIRGKGLRLRSLPADPGCAA